MTIIENVPIHTEFVKLQDLLKLSGAVYTGGEAKMVIQEGFVTVNGKVCTMRSSKIRPGDVVTFEGHTFSVHYEN